MWSTCTCTCVYIWYIIIPLSLGPLVDINWLVITLANGVLAGVFFCILVFSLGDCSTIMLVPVGWQWAGVRRGCWEDDNNGDAYTSQIQRCQNYIIWLK